MVCKEKGKEHDVNRWANYLIISGIHLSQRLHHKFLEIHSYVQKVEELPANGM